MKTTNKLLAAAVSVLLFTNLLAQEPDSKNFAFSKNEIGNLIMGITSDNPGLKKSSIYFAGKYQIEEVKEFLENELKTETDPNTKILIALSLFKIGDPQSIDFVEYLSKTESNRKVKNMFTAIVEEFELNNSRIADLNK